MGRWHRIHHRWHPDHEILPPLRSERDASRITSSPKKTTLTNVPYRELFQTHAFSAPLGTAKKYGKRFAVATASQLANARKRDTEDDRNYHPAGKFRPTKTIYGRRAAIRPQLKMHTQYSRNIGRSFRTTVRKISLARAIRSFEFPNKVIPCIQRKVRREVIMALYGGGASHAKKRRTKNSDIGC